MTRLLKVLLGGLVIVAACYKVEQSAELTEPGYVEQVTYVPGGTGSGVGVGTSSSGSMVVTSTTVTIPDRYAVVISCPHGKFTLKPEGANAARLWKVLRQGDSVTIRYRETYHVKDGVRELAGLDFVDAKRRSPAERKGEE